MPCILKTLHTTDYYAKAPRCARAAPLTTDNPGIVVTKSLDAAAIALMVVFFALLGTAIVLIAVFCSKRSLDKECERADKIQLATLQDRNAAGKVSTVSSSHASVITPSIADSSKIELPRLQIEQSRGGGPTIRDRRGLPELSVKFNNLLPQHPPPTHRSQPSAVFPGMRYFGMGQVGNDGKIHRPESIFEHLSP